MNESSENSEKNMATQDLFRVTIAFTDPDSEQREAEALKLLPQLKAMDEVESVGGKVDRAGGGRQWSQAEGEGE